MSTAVGKKGARYQEYSGRCRNIFSGDKLPIIEEDLGFHLAYCERDNFLRIRDFRDGRLTEFTC